MSDFLKPKKLRNVPFRLYGEGWENKQIFQIYISLCCGPGLFIVYFKFKNILVILIQLHLWVSDQIQDNYSCISEAIL